MADTSLIPPFLSGGGETGALLRAADWDFHILGNPEGWPQSLKTSLGIVLGSSCPMCIWWGKDRPVRLYNDAFIPVMGKKHPEALGKPALETPDGSLAFINRVFEAVAPNDSQAMPSDRDFPGETSFRFSYSPIIGESGETEGLLCIGRDEAPNEPERHHETYFRRIADGVPMMIWTTGREGKCTYVNKQWYGYTGQNYEESLGYGWLDSIHPDDRNRVSEGFRDATARQESFSTEYRLRNRAGEYRWMVATGLPRLGAGGGFEGYIGIVADIDDRKKTGEQLRESEERSRLAILAAELGTYEWEMDTDLVQGSERYMEIFGYTAQNRVLRSELLAGIHPDDRPIHKAAHDEALRTGILDYEARIVWSDQTVHWIKVKGKIVQDPDRGTRKMLGTVMDITYLRRFEQALKISEARLAEAQRIAGIGNWEYSYIDRSFYCSDEVYRIFGTSPDRFVPNFQNLFRIIHPQDIQKLNRTLSFTRKTGLPFNIDFRILTPDETIRHINSQGYVVTEGEQKILKIIGTLQDITLRKRVEEELIEAKSITEKSLRYKDQFLANMSHEIRTPMNAIVGFTELLLNTPLHAEQRQYIDAIKVSGENLLVIINDILDFSKLEAGAIHFERIPFRLNEVVSTLTDLMLPKSVEKGITLSVNIDPRIPTHLTGDPTRLNQILLNLVGNAIKFTERGEVKISVWPLWESDNGIELRFSVADTGIGIEPHMLDIIFEVFTQTASDTTRKYGGSGLGLAIVKQFVEKQDGKVGVESTPGNGSTFWFTLPFGKCMEEEAVAKPVYPDRPSHSTSGLRILLVEDNKLNQLLAGKALSDWNCEVEVADNGLIALEKMTRADFDLVLMDIQLPEMDGYEATRYIRKTLPPPKCHVPIIAVTAHAMRSEAQKCSEAGMNGYISKPFSPKILYEGIMNVLKPLGEIHASQPQK